MHGSHLINHINNHELRGDNTLHVVAVCSNPIRYQSRYRLMREFIKEMVGTKCVHLTVVEAAFGDRVHEIECDDSFDIVQVRVKQHTWIKESMINLGFRRVTSKYPNAKYFAWIDGDIHFRDPNWAQEALHALQTFEIIQPWSDALDLGPMGNVIQHFKSFGHQHQRRLPKQKHPSQTCYQYAHSGFAWCCTRRFLEGVWGAGGSNGPLMSWAVLGSADHHQAFACVSDTKDTIHKKMSASFYRRCYEWQDKAVSVTKNEVGYIPARIEHHWHGRKDRRYYRQRWQILSDFGYDPDKHLAYDEQGIAVIVNNKRLEHAIYQYNLSRMEDGIDEW